MLAPNVANFVFSHVSAYAAWMFQEGGTVGWDPVSLWHQMGVPAKTVVIILFIMSGWSIGVMIDRWMAFSAARKQSRAFAPAVAGALREGKIDEAIRVAEHKHVRCPPVGVRMVLARVSWTSIVRPPCGPQAGPAGGALMISGTRVR